jgi:hypothetical protein
MLPILRVIASEAANEAGLMIDHRLDTGWAAPHPQTGTEQIQFDLEGSQDVCGVRLGQGVWLGVPANLAIDVTDQGSWRQVWSGPTVGRAVAAAVERPTRISMPIDFARQVRPSALRLRQTGQDPQNPWTVAELEIVGCR